jgi:hypothetical protein
VILQQMGPTDLRAASVPFAYELRVLGAGSRGGAHTGRGGGRVFQSMNRIKPSGLHLLDWDAASKRDLDL